MSDRPHERIKITLDPFDGEKWSETYILGFQRGVECLRDRLDITIEEKEAIDAWLAKALVELKETIDNPPRFKFTERCLLCNKTKAEHEANPPRHRFARVGDRAIPKDGHG